MTWDNSIAPPALLPGSWTEDATANLVAERFDQAAEYADATFQTALAVLQEVNDYSVSIAWEPLPFDDFLPSFGLDGLSLEQPAIPDLEEISIPRPTFIGVAPEFVDVSVSTEDPPAFNVPDPGVQIPDSPTVSWPAFDIDEPTEMSLDLPAAPSYSLPAIPSISDVSIPSIPSFQEPQFEGSPPTIDVTPPELLYAWNEAEYDSDVRMQLQAKLISNLLTGGSGLGEDVEQAIYGRAISRQEDEFDQQISEATDFWASRGFTMPPGILNGTILEARNKVSQNRLDLNRDIAISEAKLAQTNTHFMVEQAILFEKLLTDHTNQIQTRAFESAKYAVDAAYQLYDAKVKGHMAQADLFRTYAQVFESRIRAEIARAERYKILIEGLKLSVDVQLATVEVYKVQVQAVETLINLYRAEMEGARIQSQINRDRIDGFKARVDAYAAQVGAVTARYNGYQTQIAGESEKVKMYAAQVDAYGSQIAAYKSRADVDLGRVQIAVEQNRGHVEIYKALIDKYRADIEETIAEAEVISKEQGYRVNLFDSDVKRFAAAIDAAGTIFNGRVQEQRNHVEMIIASADVNAKEAIANAQMRTEISRANIMANAQITSATIATVSASTHVSTSSNKNVSESKSVSQNSSQISSSSRSTSNNVSHVYAHDS